jgi:hypothetical protein
MLFLILACSFKFIFYKKNIIEFWLIHEINKNNLIIKILYIKNK